MRASEEKEEPLSASVTMLRVASGSDDLGELPVPTVKLWLKTGKLTPQDYYFHKGHNDWLPLETCDELK